jgi:acetoin utilization deacetylase AcuC-like enzyme
MHFVYSPRYFAEIGAHVFPIKKYRLIYERLVAEHNFPETAFIQPEAATREQLLRVHTAAYLEDLDKLRHTARTAYSELPLTKEIVAMSLLACGGTIRAAELALEHGAAVHIGGGFHHAFAERAEGFCYINDLAVAVREVQTRAKIRRAMIVDCDLHQGNGTAKIFARDPEVFTFSIHQDDLYPIKEESDFDLHLPNGVRDEEYLGLLQAHLPPLLDEFKPELIVYQAGADPYERDQLGDLKLTIAGLAQRDRLVYEWAKARRIALAVTLGGGYAYDTEDTVAIHVNTCRLAHEVLKEERVAARMRS